MSNTRPGVPTTTCTPSARRAASSRTAVPPMQAMHSAPMCALSARTTFWICWASSRVGARISACVSFLLVSIFCSTEMAKVAVLPVPDCACAITSWPVVRAKNGTQTRRRATFNARQDGALLDGRRALKAVAVDAAQQVLAQLHVVEAVHDSVPVGLRSRDELQQPRRRWQTSMTPSGSMEDEALQGVSRRGESGPCLHLVHDCMQTRGLRAAAADNWRGAREVAPLEMAAQSRAVRPVRDIKHHDAERTGYQPCFGCLAGGAVQIPKEKAATCVPLVV